MKKGLFFILLQIAFVLYLTGMFRLPVLVLGSVQYVTYVFTLFFSVFLFFNRNTLKIILGKKLVYFYVILVVVFPIIISLFHLVLGFYPDLFELYRILGLRVAQAILFLSAIVYVYKYGQDTCLNLISSIIWILLSVFVLEYLFPNFFLLLGSYIGDARENVLYLIENEWATTVRVAGFYFNPNAASFAIVTIFSLAYNKRDTNLFMLFLLFYLQCVFIFLTGSRGTLLFMPIALYFTSVAISRKLIIQGVEKMLAYCVIPMIAILTLTFIVLSFMVASTHLHREASFRILSERMVLLFEGGEISKDHSLTTRLHAQEQYAEKIIQNPIIGYGQYYTKFLRKQVGEFTHVSHNWYLETIFQYGIVYFFVFLMYLGFLYYTAIKKKWVGNYGFNSVAYLMTAFLFIGLTNSNTFEYRYFTIIIGFVVGFLLIKNPCIDCSKSEFFSSEIKLSR